MSWAQRLKRVFGIDVSTCVHSARYGSWPASKNPQSSVPSSPTSKSMARWSNRTTGPPRAPRPPRPRDIPSAPTPRPKPGRRHDTATIPQGRARAAVGDQWKLAADCAAARPRNAEIPRAEPRSAPKQHPSRPLCDCGRPLLAARRLVSDPAARAEPRTLRFATPQNRDYP